MIIENDYRWGSRYRLTGWLGYRLFTTMYYSCITSVRLDWQSWGNIHGADPELPNPLATPGQDPNMRGGSRLDFLPGLSLYIDQGKLQGNRLFIEGGFSHLPVPGRAAGRNHLDSECGMEVCFLIQLSLQL